MQATPFDGAPTSHACPGCGSDPNGSLEQLPAMAQCPTCLRDILDLSGLGLIILWNLGVRFGIDDTFRAFKRALDESPDRSPQRRQRARKTSAPRSVRDGDLVRGTG
jgi:hypothetical protein